jgi:hypothetical protein
MKYIKLFENFTDENKYPSSITVKLTDEFIIEKKLYKFNREIEMQPEIQYNLGNTESKVNEDKEVYFAEYRPKIGEISINSYLVPGKQVAETEWFLKLSGTDRLFPGEVKNIQMYVDKGELKNIIKINL